MSIWSSSPRPISLALQGGGAHGAFTWGVLDGLLDAGAHPIAAVSGTSAGAINAVLLAHGLLSGGREGARAALAGFWEDLGRVVPWEMLGWVASDGDRLTPAGRLMLQWANFMAPLQDGMLRLDPLRDLLRRHVDFDLLRRQTRLRLHIAATHANSGRLRVFSHDELTVEATLASACLPTLQPPVLVDGEPYWDGGYSANPAIFPLVRERAASDVVVVMLSPRTLGDTPRTAEEVRVRAVEIAFNAAFLCEMRMLSDALSLARRALWPGPLERRLRAMRWHLIDGHDTLSALPVDSKLIAHPQLLGRLHTAGRDRAAEWLAVHGAAIGRHSSADLQRLFGTDNRQ
ncbi:patatin-like phospholipase family protein [Roseateles saccharophilus]|nr:patatin-like phospholipase family protein [Roseateles saccharophilus]MDG0834244.1 patatin-like phospholipase family protein [Roseateles saccharophilus]